VAIKTFLPDPESDKGKELIREYPTANVQQLVAWANEFHYKNKTSFRIAVLERYGVRRAGVSNQGWEPSEVNIPLKLDTTKELRTAAFFCDSQNPYQDKVTVSLVERFLQDIEFHYLIYGGDVNDFYGISSFDKNPQRIPRLQEDIDDTKYMLDRHSKIFPSVEKKWLDGNHEDRLRKFLWSRAAALSSLACLTIPELFKLQDFGVEYLPYEQGLMVNNVFLMLHGDIASIHSGYTAKRMFEKHGGCGICAHCHRGGSFYKRDRFGIWGWWEGFCLCHLNPDWIKNPNWVQGISLVHFRGKRFWVEQVPIIDHSLMYGGKIYEK